MRRSKEGTGDSVYAELGIWWDKGSGSIHVSSPEVRSFHTRITNDDRPNSGHRSLFRNLALLLQKAGAPGPEFPDDA